MTKKAIKKAIKKAPKTLTIKTSEMTFKIKENGFMQIETDKIFNNKSLSNLINGKGFIQIDGIIYRNGVRWDKFVTNILYFMVILKSCNPMEFNEVHLPKILKFMEDEKESLEELQSEYLKTNLGTINPFEISKESLEFIKKDTIVDFTPMIEYLKNLENNEPYVEAPKTLYIPCNKENMIEQAQTPEYSEMYLRARGFNILHLHKDFKGSYDDEEGYLISISEKDKKIYLHVLSVCMYAEMNTYCLEESDKGNPDYKIFDSVEEAQSYLDSLVSFMQEVIRTYKFPFSDDNDNENFIFSKNDKYFQDTYGDLGCLDRNMYYFGTIMRLPFTEYESEAESIKALSSKEYTPQTDVTEYIVDTVIEELEDLEEDYLEGDLDNGELDFYNEYKHYLNYDKFELELIK